MTARRHEGEGDPSLKHLSVISVYLISADWSLYKSLLFRSSTNLFVLHISFASCEAVLLALMPSPLIASQWTTPRANTSQNTMRARFRGVITGT